VTIKKGAALRSKVFKSKDVLIPFTYISIKIISNGKIRLDSFESKAKIEHIKLDR
jgi:hypothetical protein